MKYIDADLLRKDLNNWKEATVDAVGEYSDGVRFALEHFTFVLDSLQQEKQEVDLEEVVMIDNVIMNMTAEGYNNGYKTRPFYEEVLRRLNAKKQ